MEVRFPGSTDALALSPAELTAVTFVARVTELSVQVENRSDAAIDVVATGENDGIGLLPSSFVLPPGAVTEVAVYVTANAPGDHRAQVGVRDRYGTARAHVSLLIRAELDSDHDGHGSLATGGDDCDDQDPDVQPGAVERWYDGIDQDCLGDDDQDQDADGVAYGTDCDDTDPASAGPSPETWNGLDDDCDGEADELGAADEALSVLYGDVPGAGIGQALVADGGGIFVADSLGLSWVRWGVGGPLTTVRSAWLSYDGLPEPAQRANLLGTSGPDLAVLVAEGRQQAVWIVAADDLSRSGPLADRWSSRIDLRAMGEVTSIATADLDSDGVYEVLVGAPDSMWGVGAVGVSSAVADELPLLWGGDLDRELGTRLTCADVDQDGHEDLLVSAPGNRERARNSGAIYLVSGGTALPTGSIDDVAEFVVLGEASDSELGNDPIPAPGDVNTDGRLDILVGHPRSGRVAAWTGPLLGVVELEDLLTVWDEAGAGGAILSDLDGDLDGVNDLFVGIPGADTVRLIPAGAGASLTAARLLGPAGSEFGSVLRSANAADEPRRLLVIGAPSASSWAEGGGAVYTYRGMQPP